MAFCAVSNSYAQLGFCTGNSGAPIFTETFGVGVTNNSLPVGITTYPYSSGYPNDGFYTVSNGTIGNPFDWHQTQDHTTGDTNGKCLIVNAAASAGEFYRTTVLGLCENTTYEFSAWVINLVRANTFCSTQPGGTIPINVRFEIWDSTDTNLLASGNTGNIIETSTPNWQEYGLVFQTLALQSTVILKMINNGQGGCGNDLAIDDIEFKTCGDLITVEDSASNNSVSLCSQQAPYSTTLTAIPDNTVFSSHFYQWQESIDGISWIDIAGATNSNLNVSGVTTTRYYRSKVAESVVNVNNTSCNTLSNEFIITVNPAISPSFTQIAAICNGDTLSALPNISTEGITGIWSPALNNTTTTTYTFTPDAGQCANSQTMTIIVDLIITPTFTQVADICSGDTLYPLPSTSNEGVTGTWSPFVENTMTTTYTFTPDTGQCTNNQTMTIAVNPTRTPTFTQVAAICSGDALSSLPTISIDGITGSWSPALNNTTTTTYTFTPDAGQCANSQTMTITVNPIATPTFTQVTAICNGDSLSALPTSSIEGISGTWSPDIDNRMTTTYTFTPDAGQCANSQTMTITVNPNGTPTFTEVAAICNGEALSTLPTTSIEGVTGTWSPALDNTKTTTYTFNPDPGFCPTAVTLTIEVFENPVFSLENEYSICFELNGSIFIPTIIDTGLSTPAYSFTWFLNGVQIVGADQGSYVPIQEGNYEVFVQNTSTICESSLSTTVTALFEPDFEAEVVTDAFSDIQTIQVNTNNSGGFEYQLDDGSWQDNPIFSNVSIGEHIVAVRDKRGCIESNRTVVVMGYPKYFTPNGDNTHDTWNIVAPTSPINYLASAKVLIFDRYGKLLKQISPSGDGWRGTYNGIPMATDDYWFIVEYNEPRTGERKIFRSHFTLKR